MVLYYLFIYLLYSHLWVVYFTPVQSAFTIAVHHNVGLKQLYILVSFRGPFGGEHVINWERGSSDEPIRRTSPANHPPFWPKAS